MIEQELTYQDLRILSSEIYEAMGYKDSIPDQMVIDETNTLLKRVIPLLRPRFAFFFMEGTLDIEKETLSVQSIHPPRSALMNVPYMFTHHTSQHSSRIPTHYCIILTIMAMYRLFA